MDRRWAILSPNVAGTLADKLLSLYTMGVVVPKLDQQDPGPQPNRLPRLRGAAHGHIESARAVGLGDQVGSLEAGKQADLIGVDLTALNLTPVLEAPVRNIVPNLVYAGSGHEVKTVMVAGKVLVRDGRVLSADEAAIRAEAQAQAEEVARRVAANPVHREMALLDAMKKGWL